jgi:hypothetical protein
MKGPDRNWLWCTLQTWIFMGEKKKKKKKKAEGFSYTIMMF